MDACSSNSSGENTWLDLSKSDYAKVIFERLYWDSDSNEVGCYFNVTESVNKSPSDYLGLFKVGYDDISECLASKELSQLELEEQSKSMYCKFTLNELPDLDGYYQFVYITQDKEVCGASMPIFLLHKSKVDSSDEEVTVEKVEDGFLMVRRGLEQKCHILETEMNKCLSEKSILTAKCEKLEQENVFLHAQMENEQAVNQDTRNTLLRTTKDKLDLESKLEELQKENVNLKDTLVSTKIKKDVALSKVTKTLQKEYDAVISELEDVKKHRDECLILLETKEKENKSYCLTIKTLTDEKNKSANSLLSFKILLDEYTKKFKDCHDEKLDLLYKLNLVKGLSGLNNEAVTNSKYKKILESDPELGIILDALQEKKHLIEQVEDAKFMIIALEDSKSLVMAELKDLSKELEKQKAFIHVKNAEFEKNIEDKKNKEEENIQLKEEIQRVKQLLENKSEELKKKEKENIQLEEEIRRVKQLLENKSEELKKAIDDSHKMKCENVALRIYLDEENQGKARNDSELTKELKQDVKSLQEKVQVQKSELCQKSSEILELEKKIQELGTSIDVETFYKKDLVEILKGFNPNAKKEFLDRDVEDLLSKFKALKMELNRKSLDNHVLENSLQKLNASLYVETAYKKVLLEKLKKFNPDITEESLDKDMANLLSKVESMEKELKRISNEYEEKINEISKLNVDLRAKTKRVMCANARAEATIEEIEMIKVKTDKLSEDCERKDTFIEQLNKEMKVLEGKKTAAEEDAKDKTIRLLEAAEIYRKQYIKIEKLQKKLKCGHCSSSELSSDSSQKSSKCRTAQSNFVKKDVKKSMTNSSDSDTGEHVRSLTSQPEKEQLASSNEFHHVKESKVDEVMQQSYAASSSKAKITSEVSKTSMDIAREKMKSMTFQELYQQADSHQEYFDIPCCLCEKSFVISLKSCLPLLEHYESEHNVHICPICGELFDKVIPPQYFVHHVNTHFKSD